MAKQSARQSDMQPQQQRVSRDARVDFAVVDVAVEPRAVLRERENASRGVELVR